MTDAVGKLNDIGEENTVNESPLTDLPVERTIGDTKIKTSSSLLFPNPMEYVKNLLGLGEENPAYLVEELAAYRAEALKTLASNDNGYKEDESKAA